MKTSACVPVIQSENEGMKIGYARVSTDDRNPDLQIAALRKAGCREKDIYIDRISGAATCKPVPTTMLWK